MDWTQIFSTTFTTNFNSEFSGVLNQFIGLAGPSDAHELGVLVPFVLYSIAILVVARILSMIRGLASDHDGGEEAGPSQNHQEWRDD